MFKKVFSLMLVLVLSVTAVPLVGLSASAAAVKVSKIKLNLTSVSLEVSATKQLTATVTPTNATNKAVTWTSSNTSVATVSTKGLVTAKAAGKVTVTCKAKDGSGKSAACAVTVNPKVPTGVKAACASYNSIKITWTAVSGSTGYTVYRATSKTGTYTNLGSVTTATYTDKKAATGTTYYYKVKAYKTVSKTNYYSAFSAIVSVKAVPAVPGAFTAVKASATSVKTTWKAVTGASGYEVWMATSSNGTYSKLTSTTKTTYTKTGLTTNKTYYFKVKAFTTVNKTNIFGSFTAVKSVKLTNAPSSKADIYNFYQTAVNKIKLDAAAGYTKKEWQSLPEINVGTGSSAITSLVNQFLTTETEADEQVSAKGSDDAKNRFPQCALKDMNKIASASCTESGDNYTIVITMVDQVNPKKTDNFLGQITNSILYEEDIKATVDNLKLFGQPVVSEGYSFNVTYKAFKITAVISKDGKFVSMEHFANVLITDINATVSRKTITNGSARLENFCKYYTFNY